MTRFHLVPLIFGVLSALFLFLALMDHLNRDSLINPARKAWLRIGLIFAAVSIYFFFVQGRLW